MYGDQFGEFVCGYWGLKGKGRTSQKEQIVLELELNGMKCLEDSPKAQSLDHSYGMFSRTT